MFIVLPSFRPGEVRGLTLLTYVSFTHTISSYDDDDKW